MEKKSIAQTLGSFTGKLIALFLSLTATGCVLALTVYLVKEFWLLLN